MADEICGDCLQNDYDQKLAGCVYLNTNVVIIFNGRNCGWGIGYKQVNEDTTGICNAKLIMKGRG